ncbi:MAG: hypothetical protein AAFZ09_19565, partial [Pseudomonadota bacterium]
MSTGTDERVLLGIAMKIASVAVLMAMSALVKVAAETVPPLSPTPSAVQASAQAEALSPERAAPGV